MATDPVVAEIRELRELRAASFGFDVRSIVQDARQRDAFGDRIIMRRTPRRACVPAKNQETAVSRLPPGLQR